MHRAAAMDRIPSGGVCDTKILDIQADSYKGFVHRKIDDPGGCFPGCPAGCSPDHLYVIYCAVGYFNGQYRLAEFFPILTQTDLPGKSASGGRGVDAPGVYFLAGGNHGDALFAAQIGQIMA